MSLEIIWFVDRVNFDKFERKKCDKCENSTVMLFADYTSRVLCIIVYLSSGSASISLELDLTEASIHSNILETEQRDTRGHGEGEGVERGWCVCVITRHDDRGQSSSTFLPILFVKCVHFSTVYLKMKK